jgi:hypothetical protein
MTDDSETGVGEDQRRRWREETDKAHERWCVSVQRYVAEDLFKYVQFINSQEEIGVGSTIMKAVCKQINVPEDEREQFWTCKGEEEVVKTIKRKRQSVTNSIRTQFESK